jgi:hypothetical protein
MPRPAVAPSLPTSSHTNLPVTSHTQLQYAVKEGWIPMPHDAYRDAPGQDHNTTTRSQEEL